MSQKEKELLPYHIEQNLEIVMKDGVRLFGDLYRPAVDGKLEKDVRWPVVLIRTPLNKNEVSPDLRHPGLHWTMSGYACLIQDCRGRYKSQGTFYKYLGEAEDGATTVEWIAKQDWCNGCVVTDGPSYLCHVQTSMALLRPQGLTAMFASKGGFYNAHTSGVRNGGAYEARQWIWAYKNAPRHDPIVKAALDEVDLAAWMSRYPFARGDSPLSAVPEYEDYVFDQCEKSSYGEYWKAIGLNTEMHIDRFADVPVCFLSGWYDVYARSTVDFYVNVSKLPRKHPVCLIMGPWSHGTEDHISGEVDFGTAALVSGNLAKDPMSLSREWFDRFVKPAVRVNDKGQLTRLLSVSPALTPASVSVVDPAKRTGAGGAAASASGPQVNNAPPPQTPANAAAAAQAAAKSAGGPYIYHLPNRRTRKQKVADPMPPPVRYFRMGGGDGHRTSRGKFNHGGRWYASTQWPPAGTTAIPFYLEYLASKVGDAIPNGQPQPQPQYPRVLVPEAKLLVLGSGISKQYSTSAGNPPVPAVGSDAKDSKSAPAPAAAVVVAPTPAAPAAAAAAGTNASATAPPASASSSASSLALSSSSSSAASSAAANPSAFVPHFPSKEVLNAREYVSCYQFDPRDPCPSLGGNLFAYKNILLAGAYNQVEREDMFLCRRPHLPLSARRDVIPFRMTLARDLDVTGMPSVVLYVSSDCVDTDFTVKLIDEYPPTHDYPSGFALQVTHGIVRCRYRNQREKAELLEPGKVYEVTVDMYPTSNLFRAGHNLRLDISSSNYPHFDVNPNTGLEYGDSRRLCKAENTVYHHPTLYPSRLLLPVANGQQVIETADPDDDD